MEIEFPVEVEYIVDELCPEGFLRILMSPEVMTAMGESGYSQATIESPELLMLGLPKIIIGSNCTLRLCETTLPQQRVTYGLKEMKTPRLQKHFKGYLKLVPNDSWYQLAWQKITALWSENV